MFFVAIVSAFFVAKSTGHFDAYNRYINEWLPTAIPPILWLNTAVLLLSSVTIEIARRSMFRETDVMDEWFGLGRPISRRAMLWLVRHPRPRPRSSSPAKSSPGISSPRQHVLLRQPTSSHFFYLITGIHAVHLFLGIAALIAALVGLYPSRQIETRQILVDIAAWYWHSMGLLWLFLFLLLEFCQ